VTEAASEMSSLLGRKGNEGKIVWFADKTTTAGNLRIHEPEDALFGDVLEQFDLDVGELEEREVPPSARQAPQHSPDPELDPLEVSGAADVDTSDVEAGESRPELGQVLLLLL